MNPDLAPARLNDILVGKCCAPNGLPIEECPVRGSQVFDRVIHFKERKLVPGVTGRFNTCGPSV